MLLWQDLNRGKVGSKTRAAKFARLLGVVALGNKDQPMARRQFFERLGYPRQQLNLMMSDDIGETINSIMVLHAQGSLRQLLKTVCKRTPKAAQTITMSGDRSVLATVQVFANFCGGMDFMVEVRDKSGDRSLKVNIVLPQCVIGIDKQRLSGAHCYRRFLAGGHTPLYDAY